MLDQELTTQWERNVEWYEKTANRPREWGELKNNVPKQCKRDEWGGSSEINIWSIITKTIMVEINVDNETALIHYPDSYTTTGLNLRTQMQALKDMQATTHTKNPEYLIYGQNHYNAVWYNTKIKTKGNNKIKRKKEKKQIKNKKIKTTQHKKEKRKVQGKERRRKKTKIDNNTQHKKLNSNNTKRKNKTIKSNKKKRKIKRGKRIENYIEQKFKIQKQQQPFYRISELALLNKEKTIQEKTYHITQQTHKHANTNQRTDEQTQRSTDNTDIENMLERKSKWKKKE